MRVRLNRFQRLDEWLLPGSGIDKFYDIIGYSFDCYKQRKERLNEMWVRIAVDQINHRRKVFGMMDFIGAIGGVSRVFFSLAIFLYGGYAGFNKSVQVM